MTRSSWRKPASRPSSGEAGYTVQELRWTRPTIDFNGIWGGFTGEGSKTVTPAKAHLKITSRLVPDQRPQRSSS